LKITKSHPASKGNRVKKVFSIDYQSFTNINLTAMPVRGIILVEKTFRSRKGVPPAGIDLVMTFSGTQETDIRQCECEFECGKEREI